MPPNCHMESASLASESDHLPGECLALSHPSGSDTHRYLGIPLELLAMDDRPEIDPFAMGMKPYQFRTFRASRDSSLLVRFWAIVTEPNIRIPDKKQQKCADYLDVGTLIRKSWEFLAVMESYNETVHLVRQPANPRAAHKIPSIRS